MLETPAKSLAMAGHIKLKTPVRTRVRWDFLLVGARGLPYLREVISSGEHPGAGFTFSMLQGITMRPTCLGTLRKEKTMRVGINGFGRIGRSIFRGDAGVRYKIVHMI